MSIKFYKGWNKYDEIFSNVVRQYALKDRSYTELPQRKKTIKFTTTYNWNKNSPLFSNVIRQYALKERSHSELYQRENTERLIEQVELCVNAHEFHQLPRIRWLNQWYKKSPYGSAQTNGTLGRRLRAILMTSSTTETALANVRRASFRALLMRERLARSTVRRQMRLALRDFNTWPLQVRGRVGEQVERAGPLGPSLENMIPNVRRAEILKIDIALEKVHFWLERVDEFMQATRRRLLGPRPRTQDVTGWEQFVVEFSKEPSQSEAFREEDKEKASEIFRNLMQFMMNEEEEGLKYRELQLPAALHTPLQKPRPSITKTLERRGKAGAKPIGKPGTMASTDPIGIPNTLVPAKPIGMPDPQPSAKSIDTVKSPLTPRELTPPPRKSQPGYRTKRLNSAGQLRSLVKPVESEVPPPKEPQSQTRITKMKVGRLRRARANPIGIPKCRIKPLGLLNSKQKIPLIAVSRTRPRRIGAKKRKGKS